MYTQRTKKAKKQEKKIDIKQADKCHFPYSFVYIVSRDPLAVCCRWMMLIPRIAALVSINKPTKKKKDNFVLLIIEDRWKIWEETKAVMNERIGGEGMMMMTTKKRDYTHR